MSRRAVLYALNDEELKTLKKKNKKERYDYMLEEIEEKLIGTDRSCEIDQAWEGIQLCLGAGIWREANFVPLNVVFGGEYLVDNENEVISLKTKDDVKKIANFLKKNTLQDIIKSNFEKINEEGFTRKDADGLEYTLSWSKNLLPFYENASKNNYHVIFTVDL